KNYWQSVGYCIQCVCLTGYKHTGVIIRSVRSSILSSRSVRQKENVCTPTSFSLKK
ncbi:hypothetical protein AMECASPLE_037498, partial [Ameca splendens]